MRWGLIPGWWKKAAKEMPATFNARAESVAEKPMFRDAFKDAPLHHPGERILRMDGREGRQAAASLHGGRRLAGARLRRAMGSLARSRRPAKRSCPARSSSPARAHGWSPITTACRCCWRKRISMRGLTARWAPKRSSRRRNPPCANGPVSPRLNRTGVGDDDPTIIEPTTPN